ncbi:MAG: DUF983 domain-containing protein [Rickettsiales bacterium]|nr:DUF983 domain-containing protein [Rickettsiales bacterium]
MDFSFMKCVCPKCQHDTLFNGFIKFHDKCEHCGLDFSKGDIADGPAYVVMCLVMTIIMILVALCELYFAPSYVVHALLWVPLTVLLSWVLLRYVRSLFLYMQFKTRRELFEEESAHIDS